MQIPIRVSAFFIIGWGFEEDGTSLFCFPYVFPYAEENAGQIPHLPPFGKELQILFICGTMTKRR